MCEKITEIIEEEFYQYLRIRRYTVYQIESELNSLNRYHHNAISAADTKLNGPKNKRKKSIDENNQDRTEKTQEVTEKPREVTESNLDIDVINADQSKNHDQIDNGENELSNSNENSNDLSD